MNGMTTKHIEAFWENATADDVSRVMAGETVEARFRDSESVKWVENGCSLAGWCAGVWTSSSGLPWNHCQVYREPSWYANKPDPGLGFRLLEKFPDEELKLGDEYFDRLTTTWRRSTNAKAGMPQPEKVWYRRRIEVEPEFAVGQTVKVVGPKATDAKHWDSEMARHVGTLQTVKYIEEFANPPEIFYGVYGIDSRKFREDYLEPVEPVEAISMSDFEAICNGELVKGYAYKLPNGQTITATEKGFEVTQ
jgi:hypothetical protein